MPQDRCTHIVVAVAFGMEQLAQEAGGNHLAGTFIDDDNRCSLAQLEAKRDVIDISLQLCEIRWFLSFASVLANRVHHTSYTKREPQKNTWHTSFK
jgi:hypothetical protein